MDVVVWDRARFPRDKVCAGWITPQAVADLDLDLADYRAGRTLQPITGFRVGVMGRSRTVAVSYERPISYGIRRCEFDAYLLRRSAATLKLGAPVTSIRRAQGSWVVNDCVSAPVVVGAGGHWCPIARALNRHAPASGRALVVAQETEFLIPGADARLFRSAPERPELYFSPGLQGDGWIFRKQDHVNIGIGSLDSHARPAATRAFVTDLQARGLVPPDARWTWHGHAYLVSQPRVRPASSDGLILAGDAAGLAYPQSGEGIRPAIESGLMAAEAILESAGDYSADTLAAYDRRLTARYGDGADRAGWSRLLPDRVASAVGVRLLTLPWFVRRVVLDHWFLRRAEPSLAA